LSRNTQHLTSFRPPKLDKRRDGRVTPVSHRFACGGGRRAAGYLCADEERWLAHNLKTTRLEEAEDLMKHPGRSVDRPENPPPFFDAREGGC
jgi:hypothetical protein